MDVIFDCHQGTQYGGRMLKRAIPARFSISEYPHRWITTAGFDIFFGHGFIQKPDYVTDYDGIYPRYAAVYVLRGRGRYTDAHGKTYPLKPGSLFQRFDTVRHRHEIDPGSNWLELFWGFYIRPQWEDAALVGIEAGTPCSTRILQGLGIINPAHPVLQVPIDEAFLDNCLALTRQLRSAEGVELSTLPIRGMSLLAQLFLMAEHKRESTPAEDLVERACAIIRETLDERASLPELLGQLPVSYSWLRSLFQRKMKRSMEDYRIRCRIDRALSLLTTGMTVKQTALKLGYSDSFAFSNQFKKVTGYPPTGHPGIK